MQTSNCFNYVFSCLPSSVFPKSLVTVGRNMGETLQNIVKPLAHNLWILVIVVRIGIDKLWQLKKWLLIYQKCIGHIEKWLLIYLSWYQLLVPFSSTKEVPLLIKSSFIHLRKQTRLKSFRVLTAHEKFQAVFKTHFLLPLIF